MRGRLLVAALLVALAAACGAAETRREPEPGRARRPTAQLEPVWAAGLERVELACAEGAPEDCNAFDDDCDGHVDEGCAGGEGLLEVVVAWNGGADLDLELESEALVRASGSTTDGAGACGAPDDARARLSRAAFADVPRGAVEVFLRSARDCGDAEPVMASVSLSIEGRAHGPFNRLIASGERAAIATLRPR